MRPVPWLGILCVTSGIQAAELPASPADLAQRLAEARPGDIVVLAPGTYACPGGLTVSTDRLTLRGPSGTPPAILDGGVPEHLLANRDPAGNQLTRDNGMRYDAILTLAGSGMTVEGLEVRLGHVGVRIQGSEGAVRRCHVHHLSQHGIELKGDGGLAEDNLVHDAILYNRDGQCLVGGLRDGSPDQNRRRPIVDAAGVVLRRHMDWGQAIQFHGRYRGAEIPVGGTIRNNIVWEVWGEGLAAYHAKEATITGNLALNVWRMAYYLQNVDDAHLADNVAVYDAGYRNRTQGLALQAGVSIANEYEADLLRRTDPAAPLVPDGKRLRVIGNIVAGAWYGIHSGDRSRMNLDGQAPTRIDGNVVLMTHAQPGITINASLLGPLICTGNRVWRADGGPVFDVHAPGPRTWEDNVAVAMPPEALAPVQQAVESLHRESQAVSAGASPAGIPAAAAAVRAAVGTLTRRRP